MRKDPEREKERERMGKGGYLRVWVRKKWEETNLILAVDFPKPRSEIYCHTEHTENDFTTS